MQKRSGPDTCCLECSKKKDCSAVYCKTRNPCGASARGDGVCRIIQAVDGCLVCPSFKGRLPDDSRQARMFGDAPRAAD